LGMAFFATMCFEPQPIEWEWMWGFFPLLFLFGYLVRIHEKHKDRVEHHHMALASAKEGIAGMNLEWDQLPSPMELELKGQDAVVSRDLSLTGKNSLFHLMSRKGWEMGSRVLLERAFLSSRSEAQQENQDRVMAWSEHPKSLLTWQAHSRRRPTRDASADEALLSWAEQGDKNKSFFLPFILVPLNLLAWITLAKTGVSAPLLLMLFLNWALCRYRSRNFDPRILLQEGRIISLLESGRHLLSSPLYPKGERSTNELEEDQHRLELLQRHLSWTEVFRSEMMHQLLQALLFWDTWVIPLLDSWRRTEGQHLRPSLKRRANEEALATLASWKFERPWFQWATTSPHGSPIVAKGLGHPLLREDQAVTNDLKIDHEQPLLVLGGSNMSGKSTLLRALGLNLLLSRMGAVVFSKEFLLPPIELRTSFRLDDSLSQGLSFFMSELQQLKEVNMTLKHLPERTSLLFLFDEILLGTNLQERREAIGRVLQHYLKAGALGAMATHDLDSLNRPGLKEQSSMFHMEEGVIREDGATLPRFSYKLKEGVCTSGNAITLLEHSGALD